MISLLYYFLAFRGILFLRWVNLGKEHKLKHVYDPTTQREITSRTLDKRYPISYPYPQKVPIQLILKGNSVRIRVFVRYSSKMFRYYPGTNITYADVAEAGIRRNWSGKYQMSWLEDDGYEMSRAHASYRVLTQDNNPSDEQMQPDPSSARVTLEFIRYQTPQHVNEYPNQRFVKVKLAYSEKKVGQVTSPFWRWGWGFLKSFQLEALTLNWSRTHPGRVTVRQSNDRHTFQQECAHEFGHLLGLGDAYAADYRFYFEAPGTTDFMMNQNRKVNPQELEMVLTAHQFNRMQYFPKQFHLSTFFRGMRRNFKVNHPPKPRKK